MKRRGAGGGRVFGQSTTKYQRQFGGGRHNQHSRREQARTEEELAALRRAERRRQRKLQGEHVDEVFGYEVFNHKTASAGETRQGWLFNVISTTVSSIDATEDATSAGPERAALDLYFKTKSGSTFKSTVLYLPYFFVMPEVPEDQDESLFFESLTTTLMRLYESSGLVNASVARKADLDQLNHLSPKRREGRPFVKLEFDNVQQLTDVRRKIQEVLESNKRNEGESSMVMFDPSLVDGGRPVDPVSTLCDIREYDVPYVVRVCTDLGVRAGAWYTVTPNDHDVGVTLSDQDVERKGNPSYMAFDIECTKAPLKFPDANVDSIFMISYMVQGQGYLILSRHVVSQDVEDFEYTPKPSYKGPFHIFNEKTEEDLLKRFFAEFRRLRPQIVVTYNGDFFDWPFVEQRSALYGLDVWTELGIDRAGEGAEYRGQCCVHLDAFHWVQRDSYLPQGAQGLKAVTKYKLKYDPVEVDPEDMVRFAQEKPVHMATYSVSDAVATYYLYEKYVHNFIFSLCSILPMGPEDVLNKGSGTLCESLLMVKAFDKSIIFPNKQVEHPTKFYQGHLLESETYIGGKVECLETGVYRSDIEYDFDLKPDAFQGLIDHIDRDLTFAIEVEGGLDKTMATNYEEVRGQIVEKLELLRDRPTRTEKPFIYHLDVSAMYPSIILSNRLQPSAIVDDATCAACDFNQTKNGCKRKMKWIWRGDYSPATKQEYDRTRDQLAREVRPDGKAFDELDESEQAVQVSNRLKTYARNAYRKTKITEEVARTDTVCMRENDFYVDTVRRFRDRRYELKKLTKKWKKIAQSRTAAAKREANDQALVYDSLQIAHKCILNSFYGYVMRKGARWRSMEMAGIVTKNGADIITQARVLVEQLGRPLELDTDGIWCILPLSFPDNYNFEFEDGSTFKLEYPCVMLNASVHDEFTNHQYQSLMDPATGRYETRSECSIYFEVDGPYRAMILPSSTEEDKLLKKRYAVFDFDGSLAELKGFELKRRGELELIKTFQSQVFGRFLDGKDLKECYQSVAEVANHWIDVLDTQGDSLDDDELVELISENRSMSRQLEEYGDQKGTSQTTARRLGEFLGAEMIKDKGLNCKFIIAARPYGAPVTDRAIPTAIWKTEPPVMKHFLRRWLKAPEMDDDDFDIRQVLDWDYYLDRLGKTIQKIITIPAALQKVTNPVPRISHPAWLESKVRRMNDSLAQQNIKDMFASMKQNAPRPKRRELKLLKDVPEQNGLAEGSGSAGKESSMEDKITTVNEPETPSERVILRSKFVSKDDFSKWLSERKEQWRSRSRRHEKAGLASSGRASTTTSHRQPISMEGFVRDASLAFRQQEWQVIELRESTSRDIAGTTTSTGQFVLWVLVGGNSLQKILLEATRTLYVATVSELGSQSDEIEVRKVDKRLPHNKESKFLYEVSLPEALYQSSNWTSHVVDDESDPGDILEAVYQSSTPLLLQTLGAVGCVMKTKDSAVVKSNKSVKLTDIQRVEVPREGEYLRSSLPMRKILLYNGVCPRLKRGIIAVFQIDEMNNSVDWTRPSRCKAMSILLNITSSIWVVKPGGNPKQKTIPAKQCENLFSQVLEMVTNLPSPDENPSQYSSLSSASVCEVHDVKLASSEEAAMSSVNDIISSMSKSSGGPPLLLVNTARPMPQLRSKLSVMHSLPVVQLPFPPGAMHNPTTSSLPALNWESQAIQLGIEAFFYMVAISLPKQIAYSRYGSIPVGNLGVDPSMTLFDLSFHRQLGRSRSVTWASQERGKPDLGVSISTFRQSLDVCNKEHLVISEEEVWENEEKMVSPVIKVPGCYRTCCVEIDVHDLAIAALTDPMIEETRSARTGGLSSLTASKGTNSPTAVNLFGSASDKANNQSGGPLGDSMSTSVSIQLLRVMIGVWMQDAFSANSEVGDDMLHQIYRVVSSPDSLMNDPALCRTIHSLMETTFLHLLGELQRLGCKIICATFNRIIVGTTKPTLADAQEYISFVLTTIKNRSSSASNSTAGGLSRLALNPSHFYSHFLFLDETNFGGMELERIDSVDYQGGMVSETENGGQLVSSVVSEWAIANYIGNLTAKNYFQVVVGRFSKDVMRKEADLIQHYGSDERTIREKLLAFKKKLVCKIFSANLTRALHEVASGGDGDLIAPTMIGVNHQDTDSSLQFVKTVMIVLGLDSEVQDETNTLKRSLLSQLGIAEYAKGVSWANPVTSLVLPHMYCTECQECRDLDLHLLPPLEDDEPVPKRFWACQDCGTPYDVEKIELALMERLNRKVVRFQLQDLRCSKTNTLGNRVLSRHSANSSQLGLDVTQSEIQEESRVLTELAQHHELHNLQETLEQLFETV